MDSDGLICGGVQMLLTQSILCGLFGLFYHAVSLQSTLHSVFNSVHTLMKMDLHVYRYIAHCTYNTSYMLHVWYMFMHSYETRHTLKMTFYYGSRCMLL